MAIRTLAPSLLRPSRNDAFAQAVACEVEFVGKHLKAQTFAAVIHPKRLSHVVGLLLLCRPAAVTRRIVSIHINAIKARPAWAFSHVFQKAIERLPSIANLYAAPSVRRIAHMIGVITALPHGMPRFVGRAMSTSAMPVPGRTVRQRARSRAILAVASNPRCRVAFDRSAASQAGCVSRKFISRGLSPLILWPVSPDAISQGCARDSKRLGEGAKRNRFPSVSNHFCHAHSLAHVTRKAQVNGWPDTHGD